jgi:hypothetical protein
MARRRRPFYNNLGRKYRIEPTRTPDAAPRVANHFPTPWTFHLSEDAVSRWRREEWSWDLLDNIFDERPTEDGGATEEEEVSED